MVISEVHESASDLQLSAPFVTRQVELWSMPASTCTQVHSCQFHIFSNAQMALPFTDVNIQFANHLNAELLN